MTLETTLCWTVFRRRMRMVCAYCSLHSSAGTIRKGKFWFLFGVLGVVIISLYFIVILHRAAATPWVNVLIGEKEYIVEKVDTPAKREKGLGQRNSLCAACGMLFVFEKPDQYAFWMKDMRFALDIIWVLDETVVSVAHNVEPDFSGILNPGVVADSVIEINASSARNIEIGERVYFLH